MHHEPRRVVNPRRPQPIAQTHATAAKLNAAGSGTGAR